MTYVIRAAIQLVIVLSLCASCKKCINSDNTLQKSIADATTVDDLPETEPTHWTSEETPINADISGFWKGLPERYSMTTKNYPLIVFIHGIGELGTDLPAVNCCGLPRLLYNKTFPQNFVVNDINYSFIVIAPQFLYRPSAEQVQSVIDYARKRWRIDDTRIYVTGMSMGGGCTWDWAAEFGEHAAAIVPVCGGRKPSTQMTSDIASKNLPIWGLYSTEDMLVPVQWGIDFFNWIDAANEDYASKTKLTIWNDASHNATSARAYHPETVIDGYNIYEWMLLHKRQIIETGTETNHRPVARAGANKNIYISEGINRVTLDGTSSTDEDGDILEYDWTKISGPKADMFDFGKGKTYAAHLVRGTYWFRLRVTDEKRSFDTDVIKVTVN